MIQLVSHIPNLISLYFRLLADKRIPILVRILPILATIYVISPIDILPGIVVPFLGWMEDIVIFYLCMRYFAHTVPREIIDEHIKYIESARKH